MQCIDEIDILTSLEDHEVGRLGPWARQRPFIHSPLEDELKDMLVRGGRADRDNGATAGPYHQVRVQAAAAEEEEDSEDFAVVRIPGHRCPVTQCCGSEVLT